MPQLIAAGRRLDYRLIAGDPARPCLVFLHEGLGSAELWRDFPDKLAAATGLGALVYSRCGYGASETLRERRGVDYMHLEALDSLPEILDQLGLARPILVGQSDGASIALIHAGGAGRPTAGLILEAPHVFVEDVTIAGIEAAKRAYLTTDLPARLARRHADADKTFWGWNDIWLDPEFRAWSIAAFLPAVAVPMLLIQGLDDEYGTLAQLDAIAAEAPGPVERLHLSKCGHAPHRDQEETVLAAMAAFVARIAAP